MPREAVDAPSLEALKVRLDGGPEQPELVGSISAYGRGLG